MKTHKVRPVLVESIESTLHLSHGKLLITSIVSTGKSDLYKSIPQELILISLEDEKIEVGDLYIMDEFLMNPVKDENEADRCNNHPSIAPFCKKVVARQSQISPEYISKFIEQYNMGGVEVFEIETWCGEKNCNCTTRQQNCFRANLNQIPKLTNGFVTIVEKEYSYNLLCNMQYYMEYCQANGYVTPQDWLNKFKHYSDRKEPISYTENDMRDAFEAGHKLGWSGYPNTDNWTQPKFEEWFNENKKK